MKKKKSGGRATPKGTVNPPKPTTQKPDSRHERSDFGGAPELPGKSRKQQEWVARPVSHNNGNR